MMKREKKREQNDIRHNEINKTISILIFRFVLVLYAIPM